MSDRHSEKGKLARRWFSGTVLFSLCAHALILRLPTSPFSSTQFSSTQTEAQSVIEDPSASLSSSATLETDAISIAQLPQPKTPPPELALPSSTQLAAQRPQLPPPSPPEPIYQLAPAPVSAPPPQRVAPAVQPVAPTSSPAPTPAPSPTPTPTPTPSPQPSPSPSPDPTPLPPEQGMVVALGEDFPHLIGGQPNCFGLTNCHRVSGQGSYRRAASQLVEGMRANGYQVTMRDDIDEQGHRVYEVVMPSEPETTYYLNVFSDSADSMVYAMTLEIVSLAELQQLAA